MMSISTAKIDALPCLPHEANGILLRSGQPAILPLDERWADFIESSSQSNFFHHPLWINLLAECYGYRSFLVADCDHAGKIQAGLPIMEIRSPFTGCRWVSLPFTDHCRPLYKDSDSLGRLTNALVGLFHDCSLSRIELRGELTALPEIQAHSHYVFHTLELDSDPERVVRHFDRIHKQNIRSAEKNQVKVCWGKSLQDVHRFYALQVATRHRHGVPVQPWRYFELLGRSVLEKGFGSVLLATKDDQDLAGLFLLHWHDTLICKYAASLDESLILRPNNLLFWTAIRWACENGFKVFDMGRTDIENVGLRRFKKGWGSQEFPLTYFVLSPIPCKAGIPRLVPELLKIIIRNSPLWLCRLLGEMLYRHIG